MNYAPKNRGERLLRHPWIARLTSNDPVTTRRVILAASAAVVLEIAIVATTFLPSGPPVPQAVVFVLFVAIFPLHFRTVLMAISLRPYISQRQLVQALPAAVRIAVAVLACAAIVVFLASFQGLPGQPEDINGRYYFREHGSLIATNEAGYQYVVALQDRIFAAIPAVFFAVGAAANLALLRRRSSGLLPT